MRERFINAGLVLASLLLSYLVLDFGVLHHFIDHVPLRLNKFLGRAMIFGQSSKAGPIPHDYIAVFGDSYAEGVGDWLYEVGNRGNPDFQATHVLHRLTGRDVITFGKGGTGQLENLVVLPVEAFESINDDTTFHLDPPKQIFAYFYEGTNLGNNIYETRELVARTQGHPSDRDVAAYVQEVAAEHTQRIRHDWRPWRRLTLLVFALELLRYDWHELMGSNPPALPYPMVPPGTVTAARIGGRIVPLPDGLLDPDLSLSPEQTAISIAVFRASLAFLRGYFPGVPLTVVYIPSPLSAYDLVSEKVKVVAHERERDGLEHVYDAWRVPVRSDEICRMIQAEAVRQGVGFLDTRGAIRAATALEKLHGPRDWRHLNRQGYTLLGQLLAKALADGNRTGSCVALAAN